MGSHLSNFSGITDTRRGMSENGANNESVNEESVSDSDIDPDLNTILRDLIRRLTQFIIFVMKSI